MTGSAENNVDERAASARTAIKPVSLLRPLACAIASAILFVIPGIAATLCVARTLPVALEWIAAASVAVLVIFVLIGLACGFIVPLTFGLMASINAVATRLEKHLEDRLDSLLADSALRAGALDLKAVDKFFETSLRDTSESASDGAAFLSLRRMAHAYVIKKAVKALRLQLLEELNAWHRDKGEERLTVETVQTFLLERMRDLIVSALESRLRALRRAAAGAWLAFLLGPFALFFALNHFDAGFRIADTLANLVIERFAGSPSATDPGAATEDADVPPCYMVPAKKVAGSGSGGSGARRKVHLNMATMGDPVSARTVSAALTKVLFERGLSAFYPTPCFEAGKADRRRGIALYFRHAEFETESHHFANAVCATRQSCIAGLISNAMAHDIVVFAVSGVRGLDRQGREQLRLLRALGTPRLVLFVDRPTGGEDPAALIAEIVELLETDGTAGASPPVIIASTEAVLASGPEKGEVARVSELLQELDRTENPIRQSDRPFLMPIEVAWHTEGKGTIVKGRVTQGQVQPGDDIEIVGFGPTWEAEVTSVELFNKRLDRAQAKDDVSIVFADLERHEIERGQVLAAPGSIAAMRRFRALAYALEESDGGRAEGLKGPSHSIFYLRSAQVSGSFRPTENGGPIAPADFGSIDIDLREPIALALGDRFAIRDANRTVAVAVVIGLGE